MEESREYFEDGEKDQLVHSISIGSLIILGHVSRDLTAYNIYREQPSNSLHSTCLDRQSMETNQRVCGVASSGELLSVDRV